MDQNIVEKIKKLQALADNAGTEAEAANAAAKIADLCAKHNLELGSILLEKEETEATERIWSKAGNYQAHWNSLFTACTNLFQVGCFKRKAVKPLVLDGRVLGSLDHTEMVFFGLKANVESATMTFGYFEQSVEAMLRGWISEGNRVDQKSMRSFRMGCASRILTEVKRVIGETRNQIAASLELQAETTAIVHIGNKLVKQHEAKLHLRKGGRSTAAGNMGAYAAGYAAGGKIDVHGARSSRMLA